MNNTNNNRHLHVGLNKSSRTIKKTLPIPHPKPDFTHPHTEVYNINKNDFRNVVQRLTGTTTTPPPNPVRPPLKHPNVRLQRIRPPPLTPIPRPAFRPPPPPLESPVSVYMRYLENSVLNNPGPRSPAVQFPCGPPPGVLGCNPGLSGGLPSPSAYLNLLLPRSPFMPPLSPTFMLSPLSRPDAMFGAYPPPLPSPPGVMFPMSPSGFLLSPRWRDFSF